MADAEMVGSESSFHGIAEEKEEPKEGNQEVDKGEAEKTDTDGNGNEEKADGGTKGKGEKGEKQPAAEKSQHSQLPIPFQIQPMQGFPMQWMSMFAHFNQASTLQKKDPNEDQTAPAWPTSQTGGEGGKSVESLSFPSSYPSPFPPSQGFPQPFVTANGLAGYLLCPPNFPNAPREGENLPPIFAVPLFPGNSGFEGASSFIPLEKVSSSSGEKANGTSQAEDSATERSYNRGLHKGATSLQVFESYIKNTVDESGKPTVDTSQILSKECFEAWVSSRKQTLRNPEEAFRKALVSYVTVADGASRPFTAEVEASLLQHLRKRSIWPCFRNRCYEDGKQVLIGSNGIRCRGFHERKASEDHLGSNMTTGQRKRKKVAKELDKQKVLDEIVNGPPPSP